MGVFYSPIPSLSYQILVLFWRSFSHLFFILSKALKNFDFLKADQEEIEDSKGDWRLKSRREIALKDWIIRVFFFFFSLCFIELLL